MTHASRCFARLPSSWLSFFRSWFQLVMPIRGRASPKGPAKMARHLFIASAYPAFGIRHVGPLSIRQVAAISPPEPLAVKACPNSQSETGYSKPSYRRLPEGLDACRHGQGDRG